MNYADTAIILSRPFIVSTQTYLLDNVGRQNLHAPRQEGKKIVDP